MIWLASWFGDLDGDLIRERRLVGDLINGIALTGDSLAIDDWLLFGWRFDW